MLEKVKERINILVFNYGSYIFNLIWLCKGKGEFNRRNKKSCLIEIFMVE